ncbi:uncharacterized protein LOC115632773 [Scaptodrosophila lebanonensis]|uniref:Uncharacterized protein LOC115632773 n=1 Tax=Drosophila lebanonensis TaxID=7225 RepID=A0A6J2UES8_DROLE|nr:uncharacterized protein LOC115632773 [Scaptodrosophila lebanonensis]
MAEGGPEAPPGEESTAAAGAEGEAPGGGAGGGGAGEGEAGDDDGKDETVAATERTISIPKFETDEFGNWVYNPWAVTFGKIWQDTRFNIVGRYTIPRMRLESKMVFDYYLSASKYSTVCMGRSTVYNKPRVMKWLSNNVYNQTHEHRPVWLGIRREIYEHGNSEECHTSKFNAFRRYFECAMRRNQRVEYMIPQYPLHQLGYNGHYWGNLPREEKEQH